MQYWRVFQLEQTTTWTYYTLKIHFSRYHICSTFIAQKIESLTFSQITAIQTSVSIYHKWRMQCHRQISEKIVVCLVVFRWFVSCRRIDLTHKMNTFWSKYVLRNFHIFFHNPWQFEFRVTHGSQNIYFTLWDCQINYGKTLVYTVKNCSYSPQRNIARSLRLYAFVQLISAHTMNSKLAFPND